MIGLLSFKLVSDGEKITQCHRMDRAAFQVKSFSLLCSSTQGGGKTALTRVAGAEGVKHGAGSG
jgi:hypothetical protein